MPRTPIHLLENTRHEADSHNGRRGVACMHCRRQKVKCDGQNETPCSRCKADGIECVIRPRSNAALHLNDLQWQQTIEKRLSGLQRQVDELRTKNAELERLSSSSQSHAHRPPIAAAPAILLSPAVGTLSPSLERLCTALTPALTELQRPTALPALIQDAAVLWQCFYDNLAIFHGFLANPGPDTTPPSPLLFASIVNAAARRYSGRLATSVEVWEELFQRALVRLLYETRPKSWDDVVGLGIARTWHLKADEMTSGLIYGAFLETTVPDQEDVRSRRVWDFLEMTSVSHGLLHLSQPIVPETPPPGVPARNSNHVLLNALNELFDILRVVTRSLVSAKSLVMVALKGPSDAGLPYAVVHVLRQSKADIVKWFDRWVHETHRLPSEPLPGGRGIGFILDLLTLYYQVAVFAMDGYMSQGDPLMGPQFEQAARDLLGLAVGKWATMLVLWPKLFTHSTLIASLTLSVEGGDNLARDVHRLMAPLSSTLAGTGRQLLVKLDERLQTAAMGLPAPVLPVISPGPISFDLGLAAYTGSDSFWEDFTGIFGDPADQLQLGSSMDPANTIMTL